MDLLTSVAHTIKKYHLLKQNDKVVIGVSGGPDSVTLLYILSALKKPFNLTLYVAHLDHGLRKDSSKDRKFVEGLAKRLHLPCSATSVKIVPQGSLEETARTVRLEFLCQTAKGFNAKKIALGHTLDDQAETVLMRMLRGSGLMGLSGIAPLRSMCGCEIIRPLIETKRKDIEVFLRKKGIKSFQDPTNKEDIYLRNKIRLRLMPLLEKEYNRNIKEVLSSMAESVGCDYDYLQRIGLEATRKAKRRIGLRRFLRLHPAIQRLLLRNNYVQFTGDTRKLSFQHIKELHDLILHRPLHSIVDLPKGISVVKEAKSFRFYRR